MHHAICSVTEHIRRDFYSKQLLLARAIVECDELLDRRSVINEVAAKGLNIISLESTHKETIAAVRVAIC
jgi:hypothetical protein